MRKKWCKELLFFWSIFLPVFLFAQLDLEKESKRQFRTISIAQGLSQSTVYAIVQDKLGFVWMATQDGLNRYDGSSIQVFRPKKGDESTLKSSYIRSLFLDRSGVLWVGGNKGVSSFDYATETFKNYTIDVKPGEWFVTAIVQDQDNNIWLSTTGGTLYTLDRSKQSFKKVEFHGVSLGVENIWHLAIWKDFLLLATDQGLFKVNAKQGRAERFLPQLQTKINYVFIADKNIWIGTEGKGLYVYQIANQQIKHYQHALGATGNNLADNDVRAIDQDIDGNIWVGTFKGLSVIDKRSGLISNYYHQSTVPYTLSQNSVRFVYRDRQHGMWMGTYYGGVSYHHRDDVLFSFLNRNMGGLSLNDQVVNVAKEDPDGNIWIGTNDKGLNFWNRKKGTIQYYFQNEQDVSTLGSNNIKALAFDQNGNVFIGTHNAGLNYLNVKTGKTTVFRHSDNESASIAGDMVYALLRDTKDRIWVGTRSGLDRFDEEKKTFIHYYLDGRGMRLSSDEITTLMEDRKGRIWIGTTNGVNILYPKERLFEAYPGERLSNDVVTAVLEDKKGRIWVATRDGLNQYNEEKKEFSTYKDKDNQLEGILYGGVCDDEGYIWLSRSNKLLKLDADKSTVQVFDASDGVQNLQFNLSAAQKTRDGLLLFGGINGLTYFNPKKVKPKTQQLNLHFTGLDILNKRVVVGDYHEILKQHIDLQPRITLNHDHKQFTVHFNTFSFISPNKIRYRYQLEGFDQDWQEAIGVPKATYTNLKAGNYTFKVQAFGAYGESTHERVLTIDVLPPWWKSIWFYSLLTVTALFLCYLAYSIISERIRTRDQLKIERLEREFATSKLNLERIEREKVDVINKMKTDFFTNISHEFRTPLTLILAPLEELLREKVSERTLKKYHELILINTKRLLNLVDQLLEFRKTEAGTRKMRFTKGDLVHSIYQVYNSFLVMAERNAIKYTFKSTNNKLVVPYDQDAIEKICFNLLSNAFKYTSNGGSIEMRLRVVEKHLVIEVTDTGIGIEIKDQAQIFQRFYQVDQAEMNLGSGIGLAFTKRLVELHGGDIKVYSVKGSGTTFTVQLPFQDRADVELSANDQFKMIVENDSQLGPEVLENVEESIFQDAERSSILIVDDNQEIVEFLNVHLGKRYDTILAYNGREALDLLQNRSVDLIVSDVMMPEVDGMQVCKRIKQNINTCHIPVILLTAKNETEQQIRGLEAGADDYVTKPFSMSVLQAKIQSILKARKRLREFYSSSKEIVPENIAFNSLDEEFLRKAIETIEQHLSDSDFSVDKFSKAVGMSRSNLYLKLKAITGESATDFIKRIRFKKAVELLTQKQYTVAQIAYMCGFNSPSYFSTAFKQFYGSMPTEYVASRDNV